MRKQPPSIEWQVFDEQEMDDQTWQVLLRPLGAPLYKVRRGKYARGGSALFWRWSTLALFVVLLGGWAGWPASADPPRREHGVSEASQESLDTIYFRFYFYPQDAQVVQAIAAPLERQYERLRQELALGPLPVGSKLTIKIGFPITSSAFVFYQTRGNNMLIVPTTVLSATATVDKAVALTRYTENWLVGRSLDEAVQRTTIHSRWQPMLDGFREALWRRRFDDQVLRPEWVYIALQHHLQTAPPGLPTPVTQVYYEATPVDTYPEEDTHDLAVRISLADHLITTYGRQQLPDLLDGFGRYDSWEELSPAVFGVPATELEAGWHAYLKQILEKAVSPSVSL